VLNLDHWLAKSLELWAPVGARERKSARWQPPLLDEGARAAAAARPASGKVAEAVETELHRSSLCAIVDGIKERIKARFRATSRPARTPVMRRPEFSRTIEPRRHSAVCRHRRGIMKQLHRHFEAAYGNEPCGGWWRLASRALLQRTVRAAAAIPAVVIYNMFAARSPIIRALYAETASRLLTWSPAPQSTRHPPEHGRSTAAGGRGADGQRNRNEHPSRQGRFLGAFHEINVTRIDRHYGSLISNFFFFFMNRCPPLEYGSMLRSTFRPPMWSATAPGSADLSLIKSDMTRGWVRNRVERGLRPLDGISKGDRQRCSADADKSVVSYGSLMETMNCAAHGG